MVMFQGKTSRALKDVNKHKAELSVAFQHKAYMDHSIMLQWVREVLVKYTKKRHSLLILDAFSGHLKVNVQEALREANVTTIIIPGGCTSRVQPLDVSLNRPFKDILKGKWEEYMQETAKEHDHGRIPTPSKNTLAGWIIEANAILNDQTDCIVKSFKVCVVPPVSPSYHICKKLGINQRSNH
jgi:hypothetical protein